MESHFSVPEHETPPEIGQILADWVVRRGSDRILDPAMGTGALLKCVLSRFESLGARRRLSRIFGVELDPQRVAAATDAFGGRRRTGPHFFVGDFLLDGVAVSRQAAFNGIICNPPFLRWQSIPPEYRQVLLGSDGQARATGRTSGLAGLHVFFVRKALDYARLGGRLAFVLPSAAFAASYAGPMKLLLRTETTIVALLAFDPKLEVFPGVMANVSLLLFENRSPPEYHRPLIARLSSIPTPQEFRKSLRSSPTGILSRVLRPLQTRLSPSANWANLVARQSPHHPTVASLGAIAHVRRGIATGRNAFFTLSHNAIRDLRLPAESLRRFVPNLGLVGYEIRAEDIERMESAGEKTFLFSAPPGKSVDPAVRAYIDFGEATGVPEGYLTSHRSQWYLLETQEPAPIIFTYMTRSRPRFLLNTSGAVYLNNLLGIYPNRKLSKRRLMAFLAILNSDRILASVAKLGREYSGGLLKLEPGDLSRLHVPDPTRLRKDDARRLAGAFRRLALVARTELTADSLADLNRVAESRIRIARRPRR